MKPRVSYETIFVMCTLNALNFLPGKQIPRHTTTRSDSNESCITYVIKGKCTLL